MSDQRGERNPNWNGGVSRSPMRYKKRQRTRFRERVYARELVRRAIKAGRLVRQPCERCGVPHAQAHHEDYSKPLDVRWLCLPCHRAEHVAHPSPPAAVEPPSVPPETFEWRGRVRRW